MTISQTAEAEKRIVQALQSRALELDLSRLGLTALPPAVEALEQLRSLDLSNNALEELPEWMGKLEALVTLNAASNSIRSLPDALCSLRSLVHLYLGHNQIKALPERLGRLRALERLDLANNELSAVPQALSELVNLTELGLSKNRLAALPEGIGQLERLRYLDAGYNKLTTLPSGIGDLGALSSLILGDNNLKSLPESIGRASSLVLLSLSGNSLEALPESIGGLTNLQMLYLDSNPGMVYLPDAIRSLEGLTSLDLKGCPGLGVPAELLGPVTERPRADNGARPSDIIDYYFRAKGGPTRPLNEAKLVIIGDGEVGKTALVNLLVARKRCNGKEKKTEGIRIVPWRTRGKKGNEIQLNLWDFGGQEIMHATHQFFLTERTLYLVVVDARRGENESRLDYWLKLVQSLAKDSPVLVVANKVDEQRPSLDENTIREKYGRNVRGFAYTSCSTGMGAAELRRQIGQLVAGMEHVEVPLPASYFSVKEQLAKTNRDWLAYTEYCDICRKHGLREEKDQRRLIRFLHDLGAMLNFADENLADTSVLAPEWVTKGVYGIITSQLLADQKGVFSRRDLKAMLPAADYPRPQQQFIVDVMRKFELCYPLSGSDGPASGNDRWLVPGLLDVNRPQEAALPLGALRFQYKYPVLPASIISRFLVRTFEHLHPVARLYWRNGIVLAIEDTKVIVIADVDAGTIDIAVTGGDVETRRGALTTVRTQFKAIHSSLAGLQREELVPLPDWPEIAVSYKWLLIQERHKNRKAEWWDGKKTWDVNVEALLTGVETKEERAEVALTARSGPVRGDVFLSYAHRDAKWRDELLTMLAGPLRSKLLHLWYDGKIKPSEDWRQEIESAMRRARVGVLLVSKHFVASNFIANQELPFLIDLAKRSGVRLSWVLLSHCVYDEGEFAAAQALHDVGKPLASLKGNARDKVMKDIAQEILELSRRSV